MRGRPAPRRPPSPSWPTARRWPSAALIDARGSRAELGGLSAVGAHAADLAAEALHRALGAAVAWRASRCSSRRRRRAERVLVAVSGGVDSAVAALLERESGAEVLAVTLELWSDPANDGERVCCSPTPCARPARSPTRSASRT